MGKTRDSLAIKVSAIDHSVLIGSSLTIVKNKPVTVNVSNTVLIHVDANVQATTLKDESAWLYINDPHFFYHCLMEITCALVYKENLTFLLT